MYREASRSYWRLSVWARGLLILLPSRLLVSKSWFVAVIVLYILALGEGSHRRGADILFYSFDYYLECFPYILISFCFRLEFLFYSGLANRPQCYVTGRLPILYCEVLAAISQLWTFFWSVSSRKAFLYIITISVTLQCYPRKDTVPILEEPG